MSSSASPSQILLKGGTLLLHDADKHVVPAVSDLLVSGSTIAQIGTDIRLPPGSTAKVVDCTDKIVGPGFVSTHAHLWQTQSGGRHADQGFLEYMPSGNLTGVLYSLADAFWGQLSGAMGAVDGGTTTVVDHAHLNLGPDYPKTAIQALLTAGLRTVYCYTPPRRVTSWDPLATTDESTSPWAVDTYRSLAAAAPFGTTASSTGRVYVGFANDNIYGGPEETAALYAGLRSGLGVPPAHLITTHAIDGPAFHPRPTCLQLLDAAGVLGPDVLISHAPHMPARDAARLHETGARVSSTPHTELQMGFEPVALRDGVRGRSSVGVDCHTWGASYLPGQMALALQTQRAASARELEDERNGRKWRRGISRTVEEAFNLGTVDGADAAGLGGEVGRLAVGRKADIVVFDATSPAMVTAARENPVAAVVLHSSVRDVEMVIVDGVVRKEGGRLLDVQVPEAPGSPGEEVVPVGTTFSWQDIAGELLKSREVLKEKLVKIDFRPAEEALIDQYYLRRDALVE